MIIILMLFLTIVVIFAIRANSFKGRVEDVFEKNKRLFSVKDKYISECGGNSIGYDELLGQIIIVDSDKDFIVIKAEEIVSSEVIVPDGIKFSHYKKGFEQTDSNNLEITDNITLKITFDEKKKSHVDVVFLAGLKLKSGTRLFKEILRLSNKWNDYVGGLITSSKETTNSEV